MPIQLLAVALSQEEADLLETVWIKNYDTGWPLGYNVQTIGGHKAKKEDSTREKLRKAHLGKITSEETKEKLRVASTGIPQSKETRLKRSKTLNGESCYNSKLTWGVVGEIRKELKEDLLSQREIAVKFNISFQMVYCIKHNKKWKIYE